MKFSADSEMKPTEKEKNVKKVIPLVIGAAILIFAAVLVIKLISGALTLVTGAFNAVLGIFLILALVAIVVWMFAYAKKH